MVLWGTNLGDSISVNGVDLTAKYFDEEGFVANVMPETYRRSNLGDLKAGDLVNLERSLQLAGRLSGHSSAASSRTTGTLDSFTPEGDAIILRVNALAGDPALHRHEGAGRDRRHQPDRHGEGRPLVLGVAGAVHAGAHEPAHEGRATASTSRRDIIARYVEAMLEDRRTGATA